MRPCPNPRERHGRPSADDRFVVGAIGRGDMAGQFSLGIHGTGSLKASDERIGGSRRSAFECRRRVCRHKKGQLVADGR